MPNARSEILRISTGLSFFAFIPQRANCTRSSACARLKNDRLGCPGRKYSLEAPCPKVLLSPTDPLMPGIQSTGGGRLARRERQRKIGKEPATEIRPPPPFPPIPRVFALVPANRMLAWLAAGFARPLYMSRNHPASGGPQSPEKPGSRQIL